MQYREDPRTHKPLSTLGMGCMRLPGVVGIDQARTEALITAAIERGVNYFDTAYLYGGSEAALGQALARDGLRERVNIATKLPLAILKSGADFDRFLDKSLERLRTDYVDYYLLHMLGDMQVFEKLCGYGLLPWVSEQKASGRIRRFGFSFHGARDEFLALLDAYDWDFCQIQYNYSDEHFQAGVTGLRRAAQKGLPVIVMEPLLGGKLAGGLPEAAKDAFARVGVERTPVDWALRWLWDQPEVTVVLSGMNEMAQLEENCRIADETRPGILTPEERAAFGLARERIAQANRVPCTGCNYCMPCPHGVNIPACFSAYNAAHAIGRMTGQQLYITSTGATTPRRHHAGLCKRCGACERKCPQGIAIVRELDGVRRELEPFWFKPMMALAGRFAAGARE